MTEWTEVDNEVLEIAQDMIAAYHPDLLEANIGFLFRDEGPESNGRKTWGKALKAADPLRKFLDYDFVIWLARDVWTQISPAQKRAMVDHELTHCIFGPLGWKIRPHDVEEFSEIIERHGFYKSELFRIEQLALNLKPILVGAVGAIKPEQLKVEDVLDK